VEDVEAEDDACNLASHERLIFLYKRQVIGCSEWKTSESLDARLLPFTGFHVTPE